MEQYQIRYKLGTSSSSSNGRVVAAALSCLCVLLTLPHAAKAQNSSTAPMSWIKRTRICLLIGGPLILWLYHDFMAVLLLVCTIPRFVDTVLFWLKVKTRPSRGKHAHLVRLSVPRLLMNWVRIGPCPFLSPPKQRNIQWRFITDWEGEKEDLYKCNRTKY